MDLNVKLYYAIKEPFPNKKKQSKKSQWFFSQKENKSWFWMCEKNVQEITRGYEKRATHVFTKYLRPFFHVFGLEKTWSEVKCVNVFTYLYVAPAIIICVYVCVQL